MDFKFLNSFHSLIGHSYSEYIIGTMFMVAWLRGLRKGSSRPRQILFIVLVSAFIFVIILWKLREESGIGDQKTVQNIFLGILILVVSVKSKPSAFLEEISVVLLKDSQRFKSLFIGLTQFLFLQALGWHIIKVIDSNFPILKPGLESQNLLQTVGGIIAIVFASWQFSASAAENQYQSGGTLQLEKSEELYIVLRLLLCPLFGILFFGGDGLVTVQVTYVLQAAGLFYLIPFSAMLFKENRLPHLIKRHTQGLNNTSNEIFYLLTGSHSFKQRRLEVLLKDLENTSFALSTVMVWGIQRRKIKPIAEVNKCIAETTVNWMLFLDLWKERLRNASREDIVLLDDLASSAKIPKISFLKEILIEVKEIKFETSNLHTAILFHILYPIGEAIDNCVRNQNRYFVDVCKLQNQITNMISRSTEEDDYKEYLAILLGTSLKTIEAMPNSVQSEDALYFRTHTRKILDTLENLDRNKDKYIDQIILAKDILRVRSKI